MIICIFNSIFVAKYDCDTIDLILETKIALAEYNDIYHKVNNI